MRSVDELAQRLHEAFHIATTGRPGPVLVDLPKDITGSWMLKQVGQDKSAMLAYYYM